MMPWGFLLTLIMPLLEMLLKYLLGLKNDPTARQKNMEAYKPQHLRACSLCCQIADAYKGYGIAPQGDE